MSASTVDYATQRYNMVQGQLRPNKVTDERILGAMETLPREIFVPTAAQGTCYIDEDVPIASGRWLMEPMLLARLLQVAQVKPTDKVLEIACGTGYATAVLVQLAGTVAAIDVDSGLLAAATANLQGLGLQAQFVASPLERGLPEQSPYDLILVSGAVADVPENWGAQLADGGRLLVIVRSDSGVAQHGVARLYKKSGGILTAHDLFDAQSPYLPGMASKPDFCF